VKWTPASNLVVHAQAPSPTVLVTALKAVQTSIKNDQLIIKDVIPNTRWFRMTLSHVVEFADLRSANTAKLGITWFSLRTSKADCHSSQVGLN
jgi:hypothetical protein